MLFNSYTFWAFLLVVLLLYRVLPHRQQNRMLLVASYVFYGSWDWRFLSLIVFSTLVDYVAALRIEQHCGGGSSAAASPAARRWLLFSLVTNLGLLGIFKYFGFFVSQFIALGDQLGLALSEPSLRIILPVGISFYTFQTMSYTIDVYRGHTRPTRDLLDFALFVAFFPQLVAGPIERSSHLLPQVVQPRRRGPGDFAEGLYLVLSGLFLKIVVADNLAVLVDGIFGTDPAQLSGLDCLVGLYAFAFQIYGDFAGYSSIARGTAKWLGFDLMVNFRMPYLASSPSDFWQRWHISLSTWLRDYVYVPLGGNRHGTRQTYRNLLLTMLLGGLWHGANWTFLAWGAYHGLLLCLFRPLRRSAGPGPARRWSTARHWLSVAVMFHLVCLGWLLFRAATLSQAGQMLGQMAGDLRFTPLTAYGLGLTAFFVVPLILLECWLEYSRDVLGLLRSHWVSRAAVYSYFTLMLVLFHPLATGKFIYFQF